MGKIADEMGVQSYCFRAFTDNAKVAELVRKCGLSRIELCGVHIDFDDTATHESIIKTYRDGGVEVCSIGVENIGADDAALRRRLEFCKASGAKVITVSFAPAITGAQLDAAGKMAAGYGVRFAIHNHGGRHWLGNSETLDHVFDQAEQRGDDQLGLCLDTAWALDAGEDPVAMAERFASRLYGIHIKDFVFDRARKPEDVVVGTGNLDLPKLIQVAEGAGFDGACVLEYEGDVDDPVPALSGCVKAVKAI